MSTKWFRASYGMPSKAQKYLVCFKGVYYLAEYDTDRAVFCYNSGNGTTLNLAADDDLYWAHLEFAHAALSILLVEDDTDDRAEILTLIRQINPLINVHTVGTGAEALVELSSASTTLPHIILLDLYLPEPDGFHLLQYIRSRPEMDQVRVYVLSASYSREDWNRAHALRATAVFHKNNARVELARILTHYELPAFNPQKL